MGRARPICRSNGCTAVIESGHFTGKNLAIAFNNRGAAHFNNMEYARAIRDFDEAIRLNPQDANGFYHRALAYKYKAQYDRAIQDFDQAIRFNPQDAQIWRNRGAVKKKKGDIAGGDADLAKAKALEAAR